MANENTDPIQEFIDNKEDEAEYFQTLPDTLESAHNLYLENKKVMNGEEFYKSVMIPRIQLFNQLTQVIDKAQINKADKNRYKKYIDLYRSSNDDSVFEKVKSLGETKENKNFLIRSYNIKVLYTLLKDLDAQKDSLSLYHKNLLADITKLIQRITSEPSKKEKETEKAKAKTKKGGDSKRKGGDPEGKKEEEDKKEEEEEKKVLAYVNKENFKKIKQFYREGRKAFKSYYEYHKRFYLKKVLKQKRYIDGMHEWVLGLQDENIEIYNHYKQYFSEISKANKNITDIVETSFLFLTKLGKVIDEGEKQMDKYLKTLTDAEQKRLVLYGKYMKDEQLQTFNKINALYYNTSLMALILDNQFTYLYILKVITYSLQYLGLFFAEKIFSDMYTKTVYVKNKDPPSILTFYGLFLGFSFSTMLFVVAVLYILSLIFKNPLDGSLAINGDLIVKYITDMFVYHVLTGLLLIVVGVMLQQKRYFKYKTEGPRAIRAYSEIIAIISAITIVIPYFLLF